MRRASNIAIPLRKRYQKEAKAIKDAGHPSIIDTYLDLLNLTPKDKSRFLAQVQTRLK